MTTRSEIQKLVDAADLNCQVALDDMVHAAAMSLAAATNNDGVKAQLEFLNSRGISDEDVLACLKEEAEK